MHNPLNDLPVNDHAKVAMLLASPTARRQMGLDDPAFFDTYYCDMAEAEHRTRWFTTMDHTLDLAVQSGDKLGVMFLGPRGHGKSETIISWLVRAICRDRNIRILLVAESSEWASLRLQKIAAVLKSEKIEMDWGSNPEQGYPALDKDREGRALEWNKTQITVQRSMNRIDPTIRAVGIGSAITGGHYDIVIFDDVETDKRVMSATMRKQTRNWFTTTVWPALEGRGVCIVIGTRKHEDDLYAHLLKHTAFRNIVDPALYYLDEEGNRVTYKSMPEHIVHLKKDPDGKDVVDWIEVLDKRARALWPGVPGIGFTVEGLLLERYNAMQSAGTGRFEREYQHIVTSDASAIVTEAWLQAAKDRGRLLSLYEQPFKVDSRGEVSKLPLDLRVVQGWDLALVIDPAHAEKNDTDYTVCVTVALDMVSHDRYLLGIKRFRGKTPNELAALVEEEYQRFADIGLPPETVLMEKNSFGIIHLYNFSQNTHIPFAPHQTDGSNKNDIHKGVPLLRSLFENRRYIFPSGDAFSQTTVEELCNELHSWGHGSHDDILMALWIAETALRGQAGFTSMRSERAIERETGPAEQLDLGGKVRFDASYTRENGVLQGKTPMYIDLQMLV